MASVNVLVRARPLNSREVANNAKIILKMDKNKTFMNYDAMDEEDLKKKRLRRSFTQKQFFFERSYWSVNEEDCDFASQKQIYDEYGVNVVNAALAGYNACLFAYGQTGSGKTYTMIGTKTNRGLIPRICENLFHNLNEQKSDQTSFRIEVSYMEIYNEQVRDLLDQKQGRKSPRNLRIREHPRDGPFVQGLTVHPVVDYFSIENLLKEGNNIRATASTNMNVTSSRSHAIFALKLSQATLNENIPSETTSKVNLVDLAGSERVSQSGVVGLRFKEGANINQSLVTLSLVISALAENSTPNRNSVKKQAFVPYRDSVLTWLLKDSLGGNSKTIMIATVSPASIHCSETLSTLRYASRARRIVNKPVVNEDPNVKIIRELREEIEKLQAMLAEHNKNSLNDNVAKDASHKMEAKLRENQEKADNLTKFWMDKTLEAQRIFQEKSMSLSQRGQQTVLTTSKPHLIGLDNDPLTTDIVLYHLDDGVTFVGNVNCKQEKFIILHGSSIEVDHCSFEVSLEQVIIHPNSPHTYVNGVGVNASQPLKHGDILQFGYILRFRFNNPMEAEKLRDKRKSGLSFGEVSPAVMEHYRSLDSGLNDDFDSEDPVFVHKSVVEDGASKVIRRRSLHRHLDNTVTARHSTNLSEIFSNLPASHDRGAYKHLCNNFSTSDVHLHNETYPSEMYASCLNVNTIDEMFVSSENFSDITTEIDSDVHQRDRYTRSSTTSNLSLANDDLTFNLLLQSQIQSASSLNVSQSRPRSSTMRKAVSLNSIPLKSRNILHSTPKSMEITDKLLEIDETISNEDKRLKIQSLISKYRQAEINRIETDTECLRRASENEKMFMRQQVQLEDLLALQKQQLGNAKTDLISFKSKVLKEKNKMRMQVEREVNKLLSQSNQFSRDHLMKKSTFKLRMQVEDYWKKMDLYHDLLVDIELDRNKSPCQNDGHVAEKMQLMFEQRNRKMQELHEKVQSSKQKVNLSKKQLSALKECKKEFAETINMLEADVNSKIHAEERSFEKVKDMHMVVEAALKKEIYYLANDIRTLESRSCLDNENCMVFHNGTFVCKSPDYGHNAEIATLRSLKEQKEALYAEGQEKLAILAQDSRFSVLQLEDELQVAVHKQENALRTKQKQISTLEKGIIEEEAELLNFQNTLLVYERNSSLQNNLEVSQSIKSINDEQQKLLRSKEYVKSVLESELKEQFSIHEKSRTGYTSCFKVNQNDSVFEQMLALVFRSGDPSVYTDSVVQKYSQYEAKKKLLMKIASDLHGLSKQHLRLHENFSKNFLEQKSLQETVQRQEQLEIHNLIESLLLDEEDHIIQSFSSESVKMTGYQKSIEELENEIQKKFTENQDIQVKLDEITNRIEREHFNLSGCESLFLNESADEEFEKIQHDKSKCEYMIQQLQAKLMKEQQAYLRLLRNKEEHADNYENDQRAKRRLAFQNKANQSAADVLAEVHSCSSMLDSIDRSGDDLVTINGWRYKGRSKNVILMRKDVAKSGCLCVMGKGLIKAHPKTVWEAVRNPLSRLVYDRLVKKIKIVEHSTETMKIVYVHHQTRVCMMNQSRDCCCVHTERAEKNKYVAASVSVLHPNCPVNSNMHRSEIHPSGWVIEPYTENGVEEWSTVWYLVKVNLGRGLPQYILNSLAQKIPLSISALRDYLVMS